MALTPRSEGGALYAFVRDWFPLLALIVSMGIAWGSMNSRVDQKMDAIRYVNDSARVDAALARQDLELREQRILLQESITRFSQLICYRNPNPACR